MNLTGGGSCLGLTGFFGRLWFASFLISAVFFLVVWVLAGVAAFAAFFAFPDLSLVLGGFFFVLGRSVLAAVKIFSAVSLFLHETLIGV